MSVLLAVQGLYLTMSGKPNPMPSAAVNINRIGCIRSPDTCDDGTAQLSGPVHVLNGKAVPDHVTRSVLHQISLTSGFWETGEVRNVLARRDIAQLFRLVQRATGATQSQLGFCTGLSQAQVSEVISGSRKVISVEVLARISTGLAMPDGLALTLFLGRTSVAGTYPEQGGHRRGTHAPAHLAGVSAAYASRSEFMSAVPLQSLLNGARSVRASGLSLNLLCQHFSDTDLCAMVDAGATVQALILDPDGQAIRDREREEGYRTGYLSILNELNIAALQKARSRLPDQTQANLQIGIYDATVRFNILLIDERICVAQPYLPKSRGVDSPTFVLNPMADGRDLYSTFDQLFTMTWESRQPL
jgi:hypothetical protein